jgi:hypothetical protein
MVSSAILPCMLFIATCKLKGARVASSSGRIQGALPAQLVRRGIFRRQASAG